MVGVASGSGHTHFEPVSPDEDERPANEGMWHDTEVMSEWNELSLSLSLPPSRSISRSSSICW